MNRRNLADEIQELAVACDVNELPYSARALATLARWVELGGTADELTAELVRICS